MTALLLDLGNSHWKIAFARAGEIERVAWGAYDDHRGLSAAVGRVSATGVDKVLLASVVDASLTEQVSSSVRDRLGVAVRQVLSTDPMPNLVSGYRKPGQLGVDRLLAMVAARGCASGALCVIDAGTAVTIDFVDPQGHHRGGFILPGKRMFRECLLANTSIPRDQRVDEQALLGRDTATAVALAGRYAVAGIVARFSAGPHSLFPESEIHTFVGGGDADDIIELLPRPCTKLGDLVLRGLAVLAVSGMA
jgi:type III pantothenate kinase